MLGGTEFNFLLMFGCWRGVGGYEILILSGIGKSSTLGLNRLVYSWKLNLPLLGRYVFLNEYAFNSFC
jgi:hypothetical protein